jgi:hypothetical protein
MTIQGAPSNREQGVTQGGSRRARQSSRRDAAAGRHGIGRTRIGRHRRRRRDGRRRHRGAGRGDRRSEALDPPLRLDRGRPGGPPERVRTYRQPSFFERYRTAIVSVVVIAVAAIGIGWIFLGSTAAAYTCTNQFNPSPTPTVEPGSSARLGFLEDDMGRSHAVSQPQNYLYCPPASGNHINAVGQGPIQPRVYKPDDKVGPPNWVHNLEHGGLVVLYRGDSPGATADGQKAFKQFFDTFPASPLCGIPAGQISPVIARFDQMPHAYAALVWDRVLYMDTWDPALAIRFYNEESERLDSNGDLVAPPEDITQCGARLKASASPSAAPSDAAPSAAPSVAAPSPAPS